MSRERERAQSRVLHLTVNEGVRWLKKLGEAPFIKNNGIEFYTVPAAPIELQGGGTTEAVYLMVRADTDEACGMGHGFAHAIIEGFRG